MTTLDMQDLARRIVMGAPVGSPQIEREAEALRSPDARTEDFARQLRADHAETFAIGHQNGALKMRLKIMRRLIAEGHEDLAVIVGHIEPDTANRNSERV